MTVPITAVTVTAAYLTPAGTAAVGTVTFEPSITPATVDTIVPVAVVVPLVDGALSVVLWSTDDPDWAAPGWTYRVTERIAGARPRAYDIEVPSAALTLDLALVAPVVPPAIVTPYLLASRLGTALGVASLDAAGQVPLDQLGNAPGGGGGGAVASVFGRTGTVIAQNGDYTKAQVGLSVVDNTADTSKPVSTAQATADGVVATNAANALTAHEADTTAVHGIADTSALATTTALALKAPLASPTFTGTPTLPTGTIATTQTAGNSTTALATTAFATTADNLKAPLASPTFTGTVAGVTAAMVGAIATTLPDAKGDVLCASAADTPARLAVGTDGQVLTADAASTNGIKWADAAGGGGVNYKVGAFPTSGRWYRAPGFGPVGANLTMTLNRLYLVPFRFGANFTADRWGCDIATVGAAGAVLRFGIWLADAAGSLPGTLVLDAGTVQADTGTGSRAPTISQALTGNVMWCGVVNQIAAGVLLRATVEYDPLLPYFTGANAITGSEAAGSVFANSISGALASNPTLVDNDRGPLLSLRCA